MVANQQCGKRFVSFLCTTGLQNGSFEGLLDFSNFAGLLESIGYSK
jgi:hypothetical protein